MNRMLIVIALFGALCVAGSVVAQGPGGPGGGKKKTPPAAADQDEIKTLEVMLEKLRSQLDEVEAQLKKARAATEPQKKDEFKGFGKKGGKGFGPGGFGPGADGGDKKGFEKKEGNRSGSGPDGIDKKDGFRGFGPGFGPGPDGFKGFGKKGFGPENKDAFKGFGKKDEKAAPPSPAGSTSIEERLDRLLRELEDIRRELKQK